MKKIVTSISLAVTSFATALAQINVSVGLGGATGGAINPNLSGISRLIVAISGIVGQLSVVAVSVAVVVFFWFLIKFIGQDPTEKEAGLKGMGYSILAIFVMVSIWGLVGFLGNALGVSNVGNVTVPPVPVLQ